ncbi:mCG64517, partial [Mus musculus]
RQGTSEVIHCLPPVSGRQQVAGKDVSWKLNTGLPFGNPLSHPFFPCLYEGAPLPTHSLLSSRAGLPLHRGIGHPQAHGPLLS